MFHNVVYHTSVWLRESFSSCHSPVEASWLNLEPFEGLPRGRKDGGTNVNNLTLRQGFQITITFLFKHGVDTRHKLKLSPSAYP